jgi:hypothetical protein
MESINQHKEVDKIRVFGQGQVHPVRIREITRTKFVETLIAYDSEARGPVDTESLVFIKLTGK